jgi:hypothetical protein
VAIDDDDDVSPDFERVTNCKTTRLRDVGCKMPNAGDAAIRRDAPAKALDRRNDNDVDEKDWGLS